MALWLAWFFSPVGTLILPVISSLLWYALPNWRKALTPRVRAWIHLTLLASSSLAFFWFLTAPLEVLLRGGAHMLEWFLRMEFAHMLNQDALEFRILVFPLAVQMILTLYALFFTILEQIATWIAVHRFKHSKTETAIVLETSQPLAFTYGWWRPKIFISRQVWDSDLRQAVFAHEAVHCRRLDPFRLGIARVLYRLALLNPFATWLWNAYQLELEHICDAKAATQVGVKRYATSLVDYALLRQYQLPAITNFSTQTMLQNRVQFLAKKTVYSQGLLLGSLFFAVLLIVSALWQHQGNIVFQNPSAFVRYFKPVMHLGMQNQFRGTAERMFVLTIYPNSLADQAGFKEGDEIIQMCGQKPVDVFFTPWKKCDYLVKRQGEPRVFKLFFDRSQTMP